jgi:hypothetical protein
LTGATVTSITPLLPSLYATPLTSTTSPSAGAARQVQPTVSPASLNSAPAPTGSFGQSLIVSDQQIALLVSLVPADDTGDSDANSSTLDEKKQAEPVKKTIEKPKAAPANAPEQQRNPAPAPKLVPILPDAALESMLEIVDYGLLTALLETALARTNGPASKIDSSTNLGSIVGAAALSSGALPLSIRVPVQCRWRRVQRTQESLVPDSLDLSE